MQHDYHRTLFEAPPPAQTTNRAAPLGKPAGAKDHFPRLRRLAPEKLASNFTPTAQDASILQTLAVCRALTAAQFKALVFPTHRTADQCHHRLKLLFHHGYVLRLAPYQTILENKPLIYLLDHKGAALVAQLKGCSKRELDWSRHDRYTQPSYFEHVIQSNWVRIYLEGAARAARMTIDVWHDERSLRRAHRADVVSIRGSDGVKTPTRLYPDGYVAVTGAHRRISAFTEVDLCTEPMKKWQKKIHTYNAYFARKHGESLYTRRYGQSSEQVLTITTSEERLTNLKRATEAAGGKRRFWFTTLDQVRQANGFVAPMWQIASEEGLFCLSPQHDERSVSS